MASEPAAPSIDAHDEKASRDEPSTPVKTGFFSRATRKKAKERSPSPVPEDGKSPAVTPVSLFELFRFSTHTEITLDLIGLVCAAGAGASQVRVSSNTYFRSSQRLGDTL